MKNQKHSFHRRKRSWLIACLGTAVLMFALATLGYKRVMNPVLVAGVEPFLLLILAFCAEEHQIARELRDSLGTKNSK